MVQNEITASYLKALGHPVRLMIARELIKGRKCVGEVESTLSIRQANASQDPQRQWFARVTMGMFRYVAIAAATYAVLSMVVLKQWPEFH